MNTSLRLGNAGTQSGQREAHGRCNHSVDNAGGDKYHIDRPLIRVRDINRTIEKTLL